MPAYSYGYVREPKEVKQLRVSYDVAVTKARAEGRTDYLTFEQVVYRDLGFSKRIFTTINKDGVEEQVDRWCNVQPFKPSKEQVVRYLKWKQKTAPNKTAAAKYAVPLTLKGRKETTAKGELERIFNKTDDPVLGGILKLRSLGKMLTNDLPNWEPGEDGRVHSTFRYSPPTGQFNSSAPNVLNASKHSELGQRFRRMIVAPNGYKLVEFDYARFHIATMGREAKDASYIRFGKLDCHTIFTGYIVGRPVSMDGRDEDVEEQVKQIKANPEWLKMRNEKAKNTVLGNQLGLGARTLQHRHREYIKTVAEAEKLQAMLARMFPKVEAYKEYITKLADRQCYLQNEWGFRREFFDVFTNSYDKKEGCWVRKHGSDYERALSFLVQSNAFGMLKDKLKRMDYQGWLERFNFINTVHDSLLFLPRDDDVEECIALVYEEMSSPCERLANEACPDGLQVGVDVTVGENWADWTEGNVGGMREVGL